MNLKPLLDRIIVASVPEPRVSTGGIHIPETTEPETLYATVIAVGPGLFRDGVLIPVNVKVGETVMFHSHVGTTFETNGSTVRVIREVDVLVVVEK